MMIALVKRLVRLVIRDYRINWVYASGKATVALPLPSELDFGFLDDAHVQRIAADPDPQFRKSLGYDRLGATGYVLSHAGDPLSVAHFVDSTRYENRTIWPLRPDEVALVNIVTTRTAQGRGYAPILISHGTGAILSPHFARAIAFIWWNHRSSLRAFERAGWHRVGFSIELIGKKGGVRCLHLPARAVPLHPLPITVTANETADANGTGRSTSRATLPGVVDRGR